MEHQKDGRIDDPRRILGVLPGAGEEAIRAAYLKKVKEHPPDRDPEAFERIRDAYETLRYPRRRIQSDLLSADPFASFVSLLEAYPPARKFVGPEPWLEAMRKTGCKKSSP